MFLGPILMARYFRLWLFLRLLQCHYSLDSHSVLLVVLSYPLYPIIILCLPATSHPQILKLTENRNCDSFIFWILFFMPNSGTSISWHIVDIKAIAESATFYLKRYMCYNCKWVKILTREIIFPMHELLLLNYFAHPFLIGYSVK